MADSLHGVALISKTVLTPPRAPVEVLLDDPVPTSGYFLSRAGIIDAAIACLADGGYDGMTIRNIAGRLNCAVGSIYRYFTDKDELLRACGEHLMQPVIDGLGGDDDFHDSLDRYIAAAQSNGELYQLMFWQPRRAGHQGVPTVIDRIIGQWAALLGDSIEARRRWAAIHGQLTLGDPLADSIRIDPPVPVEEVIATAPPEARHYRTVEDVTLL